MHVACGRSGKVLVYSVPVHVEFAAKGCRSNAAFRFEQHSDNSSQGWSARRPGDLSEEQLGYALARFAFERSEGKPSWTSFLATNIASYLKRSAAWLASRHEPRLFSGD